MKLVLDVENTVTKRNDRLHLDPFETNNSLVMIGMKSELGEQIVTFDHSETEPTPDGQKIVQDMLDKLQFLYATTYHTISSGCGSLVSSMTVLFLIQCWGTMFYSEVKSKRHHLRCVQRGMD